MEEANDTDLAQFYRWYEQAGTPELVVSRAYDEDAQTYTLRFEQSCPPTPGQPGPKRPFLMPVKVSLLNSETGEPYILKHAPDAQDGKWSRTLLLREPGETFTFHGIEDEPIPSVNQ